MNSVSASSAADRSASRSNALVAKDLRGEGRDGRPLADARAEPGKTPGFVGDARRNAGAHRRRRRPRTHTAARAANRRDLVRRQLLAEDVQLFVEGARLAATHCMRRRHVDAAQQQRLRDKSDEVALVAHVICGRARAQMEAHARRCCGCGERGDS